jgi:hypothetical protein
MAVTLNITAPGIPDVTYSIEVSNGISIQTLLELVYDQQHQQQPPLSFGLQFYGTPPLPIVPPSPGGGLGYLVVMINGLSEAMPLYWHLLVDGREAPYGIDEEFVQDGDIIGFEYGPYVPEQHGRTGYNAKLATSR